MSLAALISVFGSQGEFNFDVYELAYEYAFLQRDNYEVAASIGVHYTELELTLSAEANLRAIVLWQPRQWLGIGLGYDRFAVDLNVAKDRFDGSLDWTYQGPMIFYSVGF